MRTPLPLLREIFDTELIPLCYIIKDNYSKNPDFASNSVDRVLMDVVESLPVILNKVMEGTECMKVVLNPNMDKPPFGIVVSPVITDAAIIEILTGTEDMSIAKYTLEIDMNACMKLEPIELAAYIVHEVEAITSIQAVKRARAVMDGMLMNSDTAINIRNSVNYSELLIFAIKDTMRKCTSLLHQPSDIVGCGEFAKNFEISDILSTAWEKLNSLIFDASEIACTPNLGVLRWMLMAYNELDQYYASTEDLLETSRDMVGSKVIKFEIETALKSLKKAAAENVTESFVYRDCVMEGLFNNLKRSGLKGIEDDLYEFRIRLKNCEDEEEAIYILRQINTRISILDEYVYKNEGQLSDQEIARWKGLSMQFRMLRDDLGKKKIGNKKSYGIFVDYDKIDQLG